MAKIQKNSKFSIWKNFLHSIDGIKEVSKNEKPMQVELLAFVFFSAILLFLNLPLFDKVILFISLFLPIFAELINSSIERVVDLVTDKYHELAKNAKDAASAVVLVSIIITVLIWFSVLCKNFF